MPDELTLFFSVLETFGRGLIFCVTYAQCKLAPFPRPNCNRVIREGSSICRQLLYSKAFGFRRGLVPLLLADIDFWVGGWGREGALELRFSAWQRMLVNYSDLETFLSITASICVFRFIC